MQRLQERDAVVIGDDHPVEAELVPQQAGQQVVVGGGRHPVDVGVGVHHRARAALPDRQLERRQEDLGELTRADADRTEVTAGPRPRVAGEVLERRDHAGRLQARDVGGAEHGHEIRVLADGLLDPAPPGIAGHVEHRGQALVHAGRAHAAPDGGRHLRHEARVERRAPGQRRRERRRTPRGKAGEAFFVRDRRNAESARLPDLRLQLVKHPHALGGTQRP